MISLFPASPLPSHLAGVRHLAQFQNPEANFPVRRSFSEGGSSIEISEDVRQYVAEQGIAEEEALAERVEEKSKEFAEAGEEALVSA